MTNLKDMTETEQKAAAEQKTMLIKAEDPFERIIALLTQIRDKP